MLITGFMQRNHFLISSSTASDFLRASFMTEMVPRKGSPKPIRSQKIAQHSTIRYTVITDKLKRRNYCNG